MGSPLEVRFTTLDANIKKTVKARASFGFPFGHIIDMGMGAGRNGQPAGK